MESKLINAYEIPSNRGYKSIELYHGDVCNFPRDIDCLVFSVFQGHYYPSKGTLIRAMENAYELNIHELAKQPAIDLRSEFDVWLSSSLNSSFKRLACVEINQWRGSHETVATAIKNLFTLFAIMDQLDMPLKNVALPVIGTGSQGIDPATIIPDLIEGAVRGLEKVDQLETIYIVEISEHKIHHFDREMNGYLKRDEDDVNDVYANKYYQAILKELQENVRLILEVKSSDQMGELNRKIMEGSLRTFELGILSRRICEEVVFDLLDDQEKLQKKRLADRIVSLQRKGIASWIISYFHIIRVFGNHYAHNFSGKPVFPSKHYEQDILVLISALNRVIMFHLEMVRSASRGVN